MSENKKETLGFQTEVKQMLHLMVHSLYSNREIFLRELVSNASDAIDKLRSAAIDNPSLLADDPHHSIRVGVDEQKQEITVSDDGIGMTRNMCQDILDGTYTAKVTDRLSSVGILNVNERMKLRYGEEYGIKIKSEIGVGTVIYLRIPQEIE